jgi:hypothetical protein
MSGFAANRAILGSAIAIGVTVAIGVGAAFGVLGSPISSAGTSTGTRFECPERAGTKVVDHNAGASQALVPTGAVSMRICRYKGFGSRGGLQPGSNRLERQVTSRDRDEVARFAKAFLALSPRQPGRRSCRTGSGVQYLVGFSYQDEPFVPVRINLRTCAKVTNGSIGESFFPSEALIRSLDRMLGSQAPN